jgi:Na+-driven multidrug efflux pump
MFVRIFNDSPELMNATVSALRVYMAMSGLFGIQMAVQQVFVSLGQAKLSLFIACLRKLILLIPLFFPTLPDVSAPIYAAFCGR